MKKRLAILTLVVSTLTTSAFAQSGHDGGCGCGKIPGNTVQFQVEHSDPAFAAAATAEMDRWNKYVNVFQPVTGDGSFGGGNGKNEIVFATPQQVRQGYGFDINAQVFGVTPMFPDSAFGNPSFNECPVPFATACGTISEADVLINAEFMRGWTNTRPPDFDDDNGPALYGATAVHELGHAIGFHHNFGALSTMNYYQDYAAQYIGLSDAIAARQHYSSRVQSVTDVAVYPFRYEVTAENGYEAAVPASYSPSTIAQGATLRFTNITIENVGTTDLTNVAIRFYLSSDANITTGDTLIGGGTFNTFGTNSYWDDKGQTITATIPASVPSGSYYVGAIVTYGGSNSLDTITYNNAALFDGKLQVGTTSTNSCTASNQQLSLNNNRFRVSASWKDFSGNVGCGTSVPLSGDTGYFWFFNSSNVELVVKVLDGRGVNGKFWVFYGALSNVEYTITVTDTQTGAVKTYKNNLGQFGSVGDTAAF